MKRTLVLLLFGLVFLTGCPTNTGGGSTTPDDPTPTPGDDACANVLRGSIDLPTTLEDTPSACDYLLEGELEVNATLTVEPGVVVRAVLDSGIRIREADLIAVGAPDQRILFEGLENAQGYWSGISLANGRPSRIEYVDVRDAGQSTNFCQAGLQLRDVVTSLVNVTVSNSFVHGVCLDNDVALTEFAENRFFGNALAGLLIDESETIAQLDRESDYLGEERPNGRPHIELGYVELDTTGRSEQTWKRLNAPYSIWSLRLSSVVLTLEPGAELIFDDEATSSGVEATGGGGVIAVGTEDAPIVFRGSRSGAEVWSGLEFRTTFTSVFEHVEIRNAFRALFLSSVFGDYAIRISNSAITDSYYGIDCASPPADHVVELGPDVLIETESTPLSDDCIVERF